MSGRIVDGGPALPRYCIVFAGMMIVSAINIASLLNFMQQLKKKSSTLLASNYLIMAI